MKARIYSEDSVTIEVLEVLLQEFGFTEVEVFTPRKMAAKRAILDDYVLIVDLDSAVCRDHLWLWSGQYNLFFMATQRPQDLGKIYDAPSSSLFYVNKPFSRKVLFQELEALLKQEITADSGVKHRRGQGAEVPMAALQTAFERFKDLQHEVSLAVESSPEKLMKLYANGVLDNTKVPFKKAMVLLPDASNRRLIVSHLKTMSVMEIRECTKGLDAWTRLKAKDFDAFIMDWQGDDIPGAALYSRIRSYNSTRFLPIVVTFHGDQDNDFRYLEGDFSCATLRSPFQKKDLAAALVAVILQSQAVNLLGSQVAGVLKAFAATDGSLPEYPPAFLRFLAKVVYEIGRDYVRNGQPELAESAYKLALSLGDDSTSLLVDLAITFHLRHQHARAKRLIERANLLTPGFLQGLCAEGEVSLWLKDFDNALRSFRKVIRLDPDHIKANAGLDLLAFLRKPAVGVNELAHRQFASPLNLAGIYCARNGQYTDALRHYLAAFSFVYTRVDRAKIFFNIGLCYKRAGMTNQAKQAFKKAIEVSDGPFAKAQFHLERPEVTVGDLEPLTEFEDEHW